MASKKIWVWVGYIFGALAMVMAVYIRPQKEVVELQKGSVMEAVYGLGTVHSERTYQLRIGITSSIQKIHVREGEFVEKNSPLVQLDSLPVFRAPFSGTITSLPMEVGEIVYPQVSILKMEDFSQLFLTVSLEQQGALRVKKSQKARISFESIRGHRFEGIVTAIFPSEGQFIVHLHVSDFPEGILPGMTADVAIETGSKENVLLVPVHVVSSGKVLRIRDGKKEKVSIKLGVLNGELAEVLEGDLVLGDKILAPKK